MNDSPILIDVRGFFEPARANKNGYYYRELVNSMYKSCFAVPPVILSPELVEKRGISPPLRPALSEVEGVNCAWQSPGLLRLTSSASQ